MAMTKAEIEAARAVATSAVVVEVKTYVDRSIETDESIFNLFTISGKRTNAKLEAVIEAVLERLRSGIVVPIEEVAEQISDEVVLDYINQFNIMSRADQWVGIMNSVIARLRYRAATSAEMDMIRRHMARRQVLLVSEKQMAFVKAAGLTASNQLEVEYAIFEINRRRMSK